MNPFFKKPSSQVGPTTDSVSSPPSVVSSLSSRSGSSSGSEREEWMGLYEHASFDGRRVRPLPDAIYDVHLCCTEETVLDDSSVVPRHAFILLEQIGGFRSTAAMASCRPEKTYIVHGHSIRSQSSYSKLAGPSSSPEDLDPTDAKLDVEDPCQAIVVEPFLAAPRMYHEHGVLKRTMTRPIEVNRDTLALFGWHLLSEKRRCNSTEVAERLWKFLRPNDIQYTLSCPFTERPDGRSSWDKVPLTEVFC